MPLPHLRKIDKNTDRIKEMIVNKVKKGLRFRKVFADSNALWEVISKKGRKVWLCEIINEPIEINGNKYDGDYAGNQEVFQEEDILHCVQNAKFVEQLCDIHKTFYDALVPGQVVHYDNGHGQFVRCEVVQTAQGNKLQPIELLGKWLSHDLPRRKLDGSIEYSYYVHKIFNKGNDSLIEPHASNIYECNGYSKRLWVKDPSTLTPISLAIPEMTEEEKRNAELWKAVFAVEKITRENDNPEDMLRKAHAIIQQVLR